MTEDLWDFFTAVIETLIFTAIFFGLGATVYLGIMWWPL